MNKYRSLILSILAVALILLCLYTNQPPTTMLTPLATPTAAVTPAGQAGTWFLIFNDEFNGTTLDLGKWRPNWLGSTDTAITNPINTLEQNCYDPARVSVSDGSLHLSAIGNSASNCTTRSGAVAPYRSGMVESYGHFTFTGGYVEARMWLPAGVDHKSVWPAFFTDGSGLNWPRTGEIDILECYGTDSSCSYHYHYLDSTNHESGPGGNYTVVNSTGGWHTYAAYWEPGSRITWYYDGIQVWQYSIGVINVPHFIIINLGTIGTQVLTPAEMKIDYVRVWKPGSITVSTATATNTPIVTVSPTRSPSPSPTRTPTRTPGATLTTTALCVQALDVWVCDKRP